MPRMRAAVFVEPGRIVLDEKPIPDVGPLDALVRVTTTTICGTDVHILKGEYPVAQGPHHRPRAGRRDREARLGGAGLPRGPARDRRRHHAERPQQRLPVRLPLRRTAPGRAHGWKPIGGWKFGNTIDGCQAEYVLVPDAMANLAPVPDGLTDEQVLMCPDIMSTGFCGRRERPACASATRWRCSRRARSACAPRPAPSCMGATTIIGVDTVPARLEMAAAAGRRPRRRLPRPSIRSRRSCA